MVNRLINKYAYSAMLEDEPEDLKRVREAADCLFVANLITYAKWTTISEVCDARIEHAKVLAHYRVQDWEGRL